MKYQILFNGQNYICQIKKGFFWKYLTETVGCWDSSWTQIAEFKSEEEIEKLMKEEYGKSAYRVRKYRIV